MKTKLTTKEDFHEQECSKQKKKRKKNRNLNIKNFDLY